MTRKVLLGFIKGLLKGFFLGCISVIVFFCGLVALDVLLGLHYAHSSIAMIELLGSIIDNFNTK